MAILESFDTIREKATAAAQTAVKKTKQLAEIAKSNVSIYSEEDKIKKAQQELGKLYYRDYVVGEEMDEAEYLPWCQQIDESKQTIADLRDYIEELKREHVDMADSEDETVETVDAECADAQETGMEAEEPAEEANDAQAPTEEASETPAVEAEEAPAEETVEAPAPDFQVVVCDEAREEAPQAEE